MDKGILPGQERGFQVLGDSEWHVYHLYPQWKQHITALRLDTPDGDGNSVEVDYVKIVQGPVSSHDPTSPTWDLKGNNQGWVAMSGGTHLTPTAAGAATEMTADAVSLVSSPLTLKTSDYRWAYVKLAVSAPVTLNVSWSGSPDGNVPGCNVVQQEVSAGEAAVNVDLSTNRAWTGDLTRLGLTALGKAGTSVTLEQVSLGASPMGPGAPALDSLYSNDYLMPVGVRGKVTARIANRGGEALHGLQLRLSVAGGSATIAGDTQTIAELAPGAGADVQWQVAPRQEGRVELRLEGAGMVGQTDLLAVARSPLPTASAASAATVGRADAVIATPRWRLSLLKVGGSYAAGRLVVFEDGKPRLMAVLPSLAQLQVVGQDAPVALTLGRALAEKREGGSTLKLSGETKIGGATLRLGVTYALDADSSYIDVDYDLTSDADLAVTGFRGAWLWAGEGTFRESQDMALFPGLEYLEAGERSSSTLDIAPPANLRFAPHPNMVTVPSMAVEKDGAIVGLMWDPLQDWGAGNQKPTAVFASPNFVDKRPQPPHGPLPALDPQVAGAEQTHRRQALPPGQGRSPQPQGLGLRRGPV